MRGFPRALWSITVTILWLAATAPVPAEADGTGSVVVVVSNATWGRVADAGIGVSGPRIVGVQAGLTDRTGEVRFDFLPPGRHTIRVAAEGFDPVEVTVTVEAGRTARTDVALDRAADEDTTDTAAQAEPTVEVLTRTRVDGSPSILITVGGVPIDELKIRLPRDFQDGWISHSGWAFDWGAGVAIGPPTRDLDLRLDGEPGSRVPGKVGLEGSIGGAPVFDGGFRPVEAPPVTAVDPGTIRLPPVVRRNDLFQFDAGDAADEIELDWAFYERRLRKSTAPKAGGVQIPLGIFDGIGDVGTVLPFYRRGSESAGQGLGTVPLGAETGDEIGLLGRDRWGEIRVDLGWKPTIVPRWYTPSFSGPLLSDASNVAFPGGRFCIGGSFPDLGDLDKIQVGETPLGAPDTYSSFGATFTLPPDLKLGSAQVSWSPRLDYAVVVDPPPVVDIANSQASISQDVLQKLGTTPLNLRIIGTERPLDVTLTNKAPGYIRMDPTDVIETRTSGGPDNKIDPVMVTGLKEGTFNIGFEVDDAGRCEGLDRLEQTIRTGEGLLGDGFEFLYDQDEASESEGDRPPPPSPGPGSLLYNNRFQVEIDWETPGGETKPAAGALQFQDSGLFYFHDPGNWELLVKVLDGCAFTDHFWVFYAATTDVEFTLRVADTESGSSRTYKNPLGRPAPAIVDTQAFATCP